MTRSSKVMERRERKIVTNRKNQITHREYLYTPWRTNIRILQKEIYAIGSQYEENSEVLNDHNRIIFTDCNNESK